MKNLTLPLRFQGLMLVLLSSAFTTRSHGQTTTFDGKHDTSKIALTVVYFVPADRSPLPDWLDRVQYFCKRIVKFHQREFQGLSEINVQVHPEPFVSRSTTQQLRLGDVNAIYARTTNEISQQLDFGPNDAQDSFPILLVLSDINWQPVDDFYRLKPTFGEPEFEGYINRGEHFPFSSRGGSRAGYRPAGFGEGLVSADGWRVPYRGSDCVTYHEGLGHTVGLPHPEKSNASVMSQAQYVGWLSESWLNEDQKATMGWTEQGIELSPALRLFTELRARPQPRIPTPGGQVALEVELPEDMEIEQLRIRYQTAIEGPWIDVATTEATAVDGRLQVPLGAFDRPTPVSYRVDIQASGVQEELWGYFQVREDRTIPPFPLEPTVELRPQTQTQSSKVAIASEDEVDLLANLKSEKLFQRGDWQFQDGEVESPKAFGARLELPLEPQGPYRLKLIVEPMDEPNGLIIGHALDKHRFLTLVNHTSGGRAPATAIENVDGKNVGNDTTYVGPLFKQGRLSQVIITVLPKSVDVSVDGQLVIDWSGDLDSLTLSDYWKTPNANALFLGSYDCRFHFYRCTYESLGN